MDDRNGLTFRRLIGTISHPRFWMVLWFVGLLCVSVHAVIAQEAEDTAVEAPVEKAGAGEKAVKTEEAVEKKAAAKAEEGGEKKGEKKEKAAPENPLNNLIKGIFGGARPKGRIIPKNPPAAANGNVKEPANGDVAALDRIDARAPYDPQVAKLIRQASGYMDEARTSGDPQKWSMALEVIKYLLDPKRPGKEKPVEDALVRGLDGDWTTMRQEANRLLAKFPPDQLAVYQQQFGGLANVMLREAQKNGDIDQIVAVATQFLHTPAGTSAANWMAMRHFDHGEFGMAARWFRQLLDHEMAITQDPYWQLKAAVAFHQAGDEKTAGDLLDRLEEAPLQWQEKKLKPEDFLTKLTPRSVRVSALDDWPMLMGSADHLAKSRGGDPLLLQRWFEPLSNGHKANEMIQELMDDLIDQQHAPVPAMTPIMVNGKAIFRTLRGVRVTDVESGKTLWETRGGLTPESLISGTATAERMYQMNAFGGRSYYTSSSNVQKQHLINLLFRNGTWGGLSSDGEQVFVLEDHAVLLPYDPGNYWAFQNGIRDSFRRDYSTNKIVAYNLATGRPRWEIGGTAMDEPFDRRLAGQYFFGVPVADGGELFAIGEKDNEIRMFALDAETGRETWSQLVAYSDAKIEQDFGRRWWNTQVGVGQGVIVCPTTMGWLVGIDRLNRSVLWAHRYSKPVKESEHNHFSHNNHNLVPNTSLNEVWGPSAPVIVGHRVVYTPPEFAPSHSASQSVMVCLDLFTGKKLWSKRKDDHLYLAGVYDDKALLVGKSKIAAISVESGSTLWTLPLEQDDGRPCGRGVAVGNVYHLPFTTRQLCTIDLEKGKIIDRAELPDGAPLLGNLAMYRGMLLSLSAYGMTAFAQKQAIEQEIIARRQRDPSDAWAMLFDANIQILQKKYESALTRLRKVEEGKLPTELQVRFRELMMQTLAEVIQEDYENRDDVFAELRDFVESEQERLTFRRITADRLRARGEIQAAFDEYLSLAESQGEQRIRREDDRRITISLGRWLAGRMEDMWQDVSGDERARLNERVAAHAAAVRAAGISQSQRFLMLFGFHPESIGVRQALVDEYVLSGDLALAQNQLIKLSRNPDPRIAATALLRMGKLFHDHGMTEDAHYYDKQLLDRFADVRLEDGTMVSAKRESLISAGRFGTVAAQPVSWSDAAVEYERTGTSYSYYGSQEHDLKYTPYRLPYFQKRRLQFYQGHGRLGITDAATDEMQWLVPLRRSRSGSQGDMMPSETSGHLLFFIHGGILHALSPLDRKVLWTMPVDSRGNRTVYFSNSQNIHQPMQRDDKFNANGWLGRGENLRGSLLVANSDYVCILGRRQITVHDAVTGKIRWTKDRLRSNTSIYGTDSHIFLKSPSPQHTVALRAVDGRREEIPKIGQLLEKTLRVLSEGLVIAESKSANSILGLTRGKMELRLFDPLQGRDLWKTTYPSGTYFALMEDNHLACLKSTGVVDLLDIETGKSQSFEGITPEELKSKTEVRAISDHANLYLIVNKKRQSNRFFGYYDNGSMPTIPVNGRVFAWNRDSGDFLWKQDVTDQKLMMMHFTHAPILLFNKQISKQVKNIGFSAMETMAIDKFNGRVLMDVSAPSNYNNFRTYQLNLGQRALELRSYRMRLRISALPPGTAEVSDGPPPAVAERNATAG